jgi:hypothetical protein
MILFQTHEHELAQDLAAKRLDAEKAEKARISSAVSEAEVICRPRFKSWL